MNVATRTNSPATNTGRCGPRRNGHSHSCGDCSATSPRPRRSSWAGLGIHGPARCHATAHGGRARSRRPSARGTGPGALGAGQGMAVVDRAPGHSAARGPLACGTPTTRCLNSPNGSPPMPPRRRRLICGNEPDPARPEATCGLRPTDARRAAKRRVAAATLGGNKMIAQANPDDHVPTCVRGPMEALHRSDVSLSVLRPARCHPVGNYAPVRLPNSPGTQNLPVDHRIRQTLRIEPRRRELG